MAHRWNLFQDLLILAAWILGSGLFNLAEGKRMFGNFPGMLLGGIVFVAAYRIWEALMEKAKRNRAAKSKNEPTP